MFAPTQPVTFPDCEQLVCNFLRARPELAGIHVGTDLVGWNQTAGWVAVRRRGGTPLLAYRADRPRLDVDVLHGDRFACQALAQTARALFQLLPRAVHEGVVVVAVDEFAGLTWLPDPATDLPRYVFSMEVLLHPTLKEGTVMALPVPDLDGGEIQFASSGRVLVAPLGTAVPTDVATDFTAAWLELGYMSEDGVSITPAKTVTDINAWQSVTPVKKVLESVSFDVEFTMMQWNADTVAFWFGGGSWTGTTVKTFVVSSQPSPDERMLAIEWWESETTISRLIISRGEISNRDAAQLIRTDTVKLPLTFSALAPTTGTSLATLISNAPGIIAA